MGSPISTFFQKHVIFYNSILVAVNVMVFICSSSSSCCHHYSCFIVLLAWFGSCCSCKPLFSSVLIKWECSCFFYVWCLRFCCCLLHFLWPGPYPALFLFGLILLVVQLVLLSLFEVSLSSSKSFQLHSHHQAELVQLHSSLFWSFVFCIIRLWTSVSGRCSLNPWSQLVPCWLLYFGWCLEDG